MRGLVTLATLVLQGLTLGPLIRRLRFETGVRERELSEARESLATAALEQLGGKAGPEADTLRDSYRIQCEAAKDPSGSGSLYRPRTLGLAAIMAERERLEALRADHRLGLGTFAMLQEELDWRALTLLPDDERRIDEA